MGKLRLALIVLLCAAVGALTFGVTYKWYQQVLGDSMAQEEQTDAHISELWQTATLNTPEEDAASVEEEKQETYVPENLRPCQYMWRAYINRAYGIETLRQEVSERC